MTNVLMTHSVGAGLLRQAGIRMTLARLAVLNVLHEQKEAMTVEEIFNQLQHHNTPLSLGTVYGTLKHLHDAGVIYAHMEQGRKLLYSMQDEQPVGSMSCVTCGRKQSMDDKRILRAVEQACADQGVKLEMYRLNVSVVCEECAEQPKVKVVGIR
jgi:Fur family ferric uptake transcriptional regulator